MAIHNKCLEVYFHMSNHYRKVRHAKSMINNSWRSKGFDNYACRTTTRFPLRCRNFTPSPELKRQQHHHCNAGCSTLTQPKCNPAPRNNNNCLNASKNNQKRSSSAPPRRFTDIYRSTKEPNDRPKSVEPLDKIPKSKPERRQSTRINKKNLLEIKSIKITQTKTEKPPEKPPQKPKVKSCAPCDTTEDCMCMTNVEEHEYIHFLLQITEDILRNDRYTSKEMQKVFDSHIKANKPRLDETRMQEQIEHLKKELDSPLLKRGAADDCNCKELKHNCKCPRSKPSEKDGNSKETSTSDTNEEPATLVVQCPSKKSTKLEDPPETCVEQPQTKKEEFITTAAVQKPCVCPAKVAVSVQTIICTNKKEDVVKHEETKPIQVLKSVQTIICTNKKEDVEKHEETKPIEVLKSVQTTMCPKKEAAEPKSITNVLKPGKSKCSCKANKSEVSFQPTCIGDSASSAKSNSSEEDEMFSTKNEQSNESIIEGERVEVQEPEANRKTAYAEHFDPLKNSISTNMDGYDHTSLLSRKKGCLGSGTCNVNRGLKNPTNPRESLRVVTEGDQSYLVVYNPIENETCHCNISMRKTALKIQLDPSLPNEDYVLVDGPVCMPRDLLEKNTFTVLIENFSSTQTNVSATHSDYCISHVNLFVQESSEVPSRVHQKSISAVLIDPQADYDLTPERECEPKCLGKELEEGDVQKRPICEKKTIPCAKKAVEGSSCGARKKKGKQPSTSKVKSSTPKPASQKTLSTQKLPSKIPTPPQKSVSSGPPSRRNSRKKSFGCDTTNPEACENKCDSCTSAPPLSLPSQESETEAVERTTYTSNLNPENKYHFLMQDVYTNVKQEEILACYGIFMEPVKEEKPEPEADLLLDDTYKRKLCAEGCDPLCNKRSDEDVCHGSETSSDSIPEKISDSGDESKPPPDPDESTIVTLSDESSTSVVIKKQKKSLIMTSQESIESSMPSFTSQIDAPLRHKESSTKTKLPLSKYGNLAEQLNLSNTSTPTASELDTKQYFQAELAVGSNNSLLISNSEHNRAMDVLNKNMKDFKRIDETVMIELRRSRVISQPTINDVGSLASIEATETPLPVRPLKDSSKNSAGCPFKPCPTKKR